MTFTAVMTFAAGTLKTNVLHVRPIEVGAWLGWGQQSALKHPKSKSCVRLLRRHFQFGPDVPGGKEDQPLIPNGVLVEI